MLVTFVFASCARPLGFEYAVDFQQVRLFALTHRHLGFRAQQSACRLIGALFLSGSSLALFCLCDLWCAQSWGAAREHSLVRRRLWARNMQRIEYTQGAF